VWLTVDSHGLEAGEYSLDLEARVTNHVPSLKGHHKGGRGVAGVARLKVKVWNFALPDTSTLGPPWIGTFDSNSGLSDDRWARNFREHGVNSWHVELAFPPKLRPDGSLSQDPVDFRVIGGWRCNLPNAPLKEYIRRGKASHGVFLIETHYFRGGAYHFGPWRRIDGKSEPYMSPKWRKGYRSYLTQLVVYLKKQGLSHEDWWWYPFDENIGPKCFELAKLTHEIDPKIRFFINTYTGDEKFLQKWLPYIGVWCVHHQWPRKDKWPKPATAYGHPRIPAHSPAEAFRVFRRTVRTPVVCYTCGSDVRRLHPFLFWRFVPWEALIENLDGFFYWSPTRQGGDGWGRGRWHREFIDVVYRDHTGAPVNTVRWEGFRDGVDDFLYVYLIRQATAKLPENSPKRRAAEALIRRAFQAYPVIVRGIKSLTEFRQNRRELAQMVMALGAGRP